MRIPRAVRIVIEEMRNPNGPHGVLGATEGQIAARLEREQIPRPNPEKAGQPWDAPNVRHAISAVRREQRDFLARLAAVLSRVGGESGRGSVTKAEFVEICFEERLDQWWLWEQFGSPAFTVDPRLSPAKDVVPPIKFNKAGDVVLTQGGRDTVEHVRMIGDHSTEELDVLRAMAFDEENIVELPRLCRRYHASEQALLEKGLVRKLADGSFELTEKGKTSGEQWYFVLVRWIENYWPSEAEEATLPPKWDWSQRPFEPDYSN